jgi:hypothetical protein
LTAAAVSAAAITPAVGVTYCHSVSVNSCQRCGPGGTARDGPTTGAPRAARWLATANSRSKDSSWASRK